MGYHTNFVGQFNVEPPLREDHRLYLSKFADTRRMKRRASETAKRPDPVREAVQLPVGKEGAFFVGAEGKYGQEDTSDIIDSDRPPGDQPELWCQWVPTQDGTAIVWDDQEKFDEYVKWIEYLIANFLDMWGYTLNGEVQWQGEEVGDVGVIAIKDNKIRTRKLR